MSQPVIEDTQPHPAAAAPKKRFPRVLPLIIVFVLLMTGILSGYGSGMASRENYEQTKVSGQLQEQYQLGLKAMDEGLYEVARQQFEWILARQPDFPGVKTAYANLLLLMNVTPTPTITVTPYFSPTFDSRSVDEQFVNAQELLSAGNWDGVLVLLDTIRKNYPTYNTAKIDGMYYSALYQRGMSKLQPTSCETINLEGGLYDLAMAERFGPLDSTTEGWRTYVRMYITGSSFWDQDWQQAIYYFEQVKNAFPSLMDSSCITATERYRQALVKYGDQLADRGDYCGAEKQYQLALEVDSPKNNEVRPTAEYAQDQCNGGDHHPTNTTNSDQTLTPTPEVTQPPTEPPTAPPTEPPTQSITDVPTVNG